MNENHLTEEEIQEYLDGNPSTSAVDIQNHLESCERCSHAMAQYRALYGQLTAEPGYKLSKNFAQSIISKLDAAESSPFSFPLTEIIIIVVGVIIALAAAVYFVDMKPLLQSFAKISFPRLGLNTSLFTPVKNLLNDLNGSLILIPFAGLALLSVALIDRFVHKLKNQKLSI
jgi:hypothetical protein